MRTDFKDKKTMEIGVISDTHGQLRPGVAREFKGVDLILHAGDSDLPGILESLGEIAPVVGIRGNMDQGKWAENTPVTEVVEAGDHWIYMVHSLEWMDLDPAAAGMSAVVSGHTHMPHVQRKNGILFLNPGSAGPRRQIKPVSLALLHIRETDLDAEIVYLDE